MKRRGLKYYLTAFVLSGIMSLQFALPAAAAETETETVMESIYETETETETGTETETEVESDTGTAEIQDGNTGESAESETLQPAETAAVTETETAAVAESVVESETESETESESETETELEEVLLDTKKPADAINFADQALSKVLLAKYDANKDGFIARSELSKLTSLSLPKAGIKDLSGLEYAVNLQSLNLSGNSFSSLKALSSMKKLQSVDLSSNRNLKTLKILKSLPKLKTAKLSGTGISDKDILSFAGFTGKTLYKSSKVSLFSKYGPDIFTSSKKPALKFLSGAQYVNGSSFDMKSGAFAFTAKKPGSAKVRITYGSAHVDIIVKVENKNISPAKPVVTSVSNNVGRIDLKWNIVKGATEYWIFRKTGTATRFDRIGKTEGNKTTSWTDTTSLKDGTKYTYCVKAIKKYNNVFCYSGESNHYVLFRLSNTRISGQRQDNGMRLSWTKINGATGYYIYRKVGNPKSYTLVKKITNNSSFSWVDSGAKANGSKYTYTVKAYKTYNKRVIFGPSSNIIINCYLDAPAISSVYHSANNDIVVNWKKNAQASGYKIAYADNASMKNAAVLTISSNSTLKAVIPKTDKNKNYFFTIQCFKNDSGKTYYSKTVSADDRFTEAELRSSLVNSAAEYVGTSKGSAKHVEILNIYNSQNPLPINYKMTVNDPWCAAFATAMAVKVRLNDLIPGECSCTRQIKLWQQLGRWQENDAYVPKAGDYIYYNWSDTGKGDCKSGSDHVGIVVSVNGKTIKVIEGNRSIGKDKNGKTIYGVGYREIQVNGRYIRGYGLAHFASKAVK